MPAVSHLAGVQGRYHGGAIKGRAHQFGHGGIDNHEIFGLTLFGADDAGDQNTGIGGNEPTRFQNDLAAAIGEIFRYQARISKRVGRVSLLR